MPVSELSLILEVCYDIILWEEVAIELTIQQPSHKPLMTSAVMWLLIAQDAAFCSVDYVDAQQGPIQTEERHQGNLMNVAVNQIHQQ